MTRNEPEIIDIGFITACTTCGAPVAQKLGKRLKMRHWDCKQINGFLNSIERWAQEVRETGTITDSHAAQVRSRLFRIANLIPLAQERDRRGRWITTLSESSSD